MALTLDKEQRLEVTGLIQFLDDNEEEWLANARDTYRFVREKFPPRSTVRPDDVAKALLPIVEVHEKLRQFLNREKLTQKYWISYFTDLVIDRTWNQISGEEDGQ
jgi:hypothetical protein